MNRAKKLAPPPNPKRPTGRASTPRHLGSHKDPVGEAAAHKADEQLKAKPRHRPS